jgi:hypothetical protein
VANRTHSSVRRNKVSSSLVVLAVLTSALAGCASAQPAARREEPPVASTGATPPRTASRPKDAEASARLEALYHWGLLYAEDPGLSKARDLVTFCGDACSPSVLARIWLTIGFMTVGDQGSEAEARAAFSRALDIDAAAELERQLAPPRAAQLFDEEKARRAANAKP